MTMQGENCPLSDNHYTFSTLFTPFCEFKFDITNETFKCDFFFKLIVMWFKKKYIIIGGNNNLTFNVEP